MHPVHRRALDLNLLVLFHAVYIERSVSAAAQQLGMSQSALSHGLTRLRAAFQDQLFVRSGLAITPTPRAQELFEPIRDIIEGLRTRILPSVSFDPTTAVREFRIGASDAGEIVLLSPLLRQFAQHFPGCTVRVVRLDNAEMPGALEDGSVELAIGSLPQRPEHLYEQLLYHHDYTVIAWSNHPRLSNELRLEDYLSERHVAVASGSEQHLVSMGLAPRGLQRKVIATVGGFLGLPWLLDGSEWVATVPTHVGFAFKERFPIRCFPLPLSVQPYPITSHWHPRSHDEPAHRWMRHFVFDLMRRYPDLP
jgi:DNA-binding transcriptional LysR family regulator